MLQICLRTAGAFLWGGNLGGTVFPSAREEEGQMPLPAPGGLRPAELDGNLEIDYPTSVL